MGCMLRRIFMSNPILFKFWFNNFRKSRLNLPSNKDSFYFDGYPRSGNSYFTNLTREIYPKMSFSHHLHTIGAIKISLKKNIPTLIIVRNPLDSIASLYVMKNKDEVFNNKLLNKHIKDYIKYHEFVLKNINRLKIVEFQRLINEPQLFLDSLGELNVDLSIQKDDYKRLLNAVENDSIKKRQSKMSKEHALRFSSTPNPVRTKLKDEIKKSIVENHNFKKATDLFHDIIEQK